MGWANERGKPSLLSDAGQFELHAVVLDNNIRAQPIPAQAFDEQMREGMFGKRGLNVAG
jgi:hypothetical protein